MLRSQLVINTSIVYMHRFYMFHSFRNFHRNAMASCFLFLSAKVEEQPRKLEHVLKVGHLCLKGEKDEPPLDTKSNEYMKLSQELINNESIVLQTLGFELSVEHPHTYVVKCAPLVKASKDLAQTSYFLATNSLHLTTFCIQYKPTVVACICIFVSLRWANWEILESQDKKSWWECIDNTVTPELLEDLSSHFIKILDNSQTRLKKRITSGPMVYKGGILQQKKHKEDGKPEETVRKHHNGNMDLVRSGIEYSNISRPSYSEGASSDERGGHSTSFSRGHPAPPAARGSGSDKKDSRKSYEPQLQLSAKHGEQVSSHAKRQIDIISREHRHSNIKLEGGDGRPESFSKHLDKGLHGLDDSDGLTVPSSKSNIESKQRQHLQQPHGQGKSSDTRHVTPGNHNVISPSQKHSSSSDNRPRHTSPLKRPRTEGDTGQATSMESRSSVESHSKHQRLKHEIDGKRVSNHELHKHKHAKSLSHRNELKTTMQESEKMKHLQHSSSHKLSSSHKHSHSNREILSAAQKSSGSKHGSHTGGISSGRSSQQVPVSQKGSTKRQKLESTDPLLPPPPPPPSFPNAILSTSSGRMGSLNSSSQQSNQSYQGQYTSLSNSGLPNMATFNSASNQYRDFFMAGLPEIPLTDLRPPPPPPSTAATSGLKAPASPPPPPPPPRS